MFQRLFQGRNGPDHISLAVLILAMAVNIIFSLVGQPTIGTILVAVSFVYVIFRMFSKNVVRRRSENYKFYTWFSNLFKRLKGTVNEKTDKYHKVFRCPNCGQKLRVPRGKGKINITCNKCQHKFTKKT
ncbi:MAG: hypothetical protein R2876_06705 [Eubacteriales bacterium]